MADIFFEKTYTVDGSLDEDKIWRLDISPNLNGLTANVRQICQYGLTEMLNNAICHSGSKDLAVKLSLQIKLFRRR